jgi:hypothetical protein
MPSTIDLSGLDRLTARFRLLVNPNAAPLLDRWKLVMAEDNRKGILAGQDKDGNPLRPVTYRPKYDAIGPLKKGKKSRELTVEERLGQSKRTKQGRYAAFGSTANAEWNNLKTSQYRTLDGPPLAPRRQFSRVITNYVVRSGQTSPTMWESVGYWLDVLSTKGKTFLHYHFNGEGQAVRDLRGVRPDGIAKCRKSARAWMIDLIRGA